ncbi:MAG TPA: hypothetical protein VF800_07930 [Telluria sp.]|jgi:hypothetical protein
MKTFLAHAAFLLAFSGAALPVTLGQLERLVLATEAQARAIVLPAHDDARPPG